MAARKALGGMFEKLGEFVSPSKRARVEDDAPAEGSGLSGPLFGDVSPGHMWDAESAKDGVGVLQAHATSGGEQAEVQITSNKDHADEYKNEIQAALARVIASVREGAVPEEGRGIPANFSPTEVEAVFEGFRKEAYQTASVLNAANFPRPMPTAAADWLELHTEQLYKYILSQPVEEEDLYSLYKRVPLEACYPKWWAGAVKRLSASNGLPPDGHALAAVLRGQVRFFWAGPRGVVQTRICKVSDSEWSLSGHKLHVIVWGKSSMGKDTILGILKSLNGAMSSDYEQACNVFKQSSYTKSGMIQDLKTYEAGFQVQAHDGASPSSRVGAFSV